MNRQDYLNSMKEITCIKCKEPVMENEMAKADFICPKCGKYNRVPARVRIEMITDPGTFKEFFEGVTTSNPIDFPNYMEKYESAKKSSGESEAVICGTAKINGIETCLFLMEPKFMMASMGTVVGDKITALFEYAIRKKLPVIGYTASGGARMQEGVLSLIQMAKTSGAVQKHSEAGLFYGACVSDPTTGGVTASFAMIADIQISEPEALIGFAGKRVIEQVTGEKLPSNFQSAEFQLKNGFIDEIVPRADHKKYWGDILRIHCSK
ncbi:MAG: acetyl-CoA carboxylase carboxyltransferase subunit beta [Lachnospiraceae bacterium]|nr:acetyl-CoA carboxylase carboxyltransferase subunit beta [Lachnospiraceae bacterium]